MVIVKTAREISKMKDACRISAEALRVAGEAVKPGITTYEIDTIVRKYIEKQGATDRKSTRLNSSHSTSSRMPSSA